MNNTKHIHAENMAVYAQDAMITDKPYLLWSVEYEYGYGKSGQCTRHPSWNLHAKYIRDEKMTNKNKKLEQLLKQKAEIEEQIKFIEQEKQKWEPVSGEWSVYCDGCFKFDKSDNDYRLFGTERSTQEQAEKARDKMRVFNRLLAYHDEYCPDYEFIDGSDENYYIEYDHLNEEWSFDRFANHQILGGIYFPQHIAKELVEKLNNGEVEL